MISKTGPLITPSVHAWTGMFRALRHRNFQIFFGGQLVSLSGTWVQTFETVQQVNLVVVGFSGFPGGSFIVGPFSVFDVRVLYS